MASVSPSGKNRISVRPHLSVFRAVAATADCFPDRPALSGGGGQWTYTQLIDDAERVASILDERGCGPDVTIAVVAANTALSAVVWLAAARIGAVVSLVNFMLKAEELSVVLGNLQPRVVLCDAARYEVCAAALGRATLNSLCLSLDEDNGALSERRAAPRYAGPHPRADEAHEVSYTSGTTAAPKGAVLTHAAVLHRGGAEVALFGLGPADVAIVVTPLFHQSGIRDTVLLMWLAGGHAVIAPKFDSRTFWPMVKRHGATYGCMVETMLHFLDREPVTEEERGHSLRRVLGNGGPALLARLEKRFGLRFVNVYGMTEVGVSAAATLDLGPESLQSLRMWRGEAFFAGWPMAGTELRLVGDGGVIVGEGVTGEIQIRSAGLLRGYLRAPEATRSAFLDGWFRTGDVGMYGPRGSLYFLDRMKDIIRRGGENIASKEVEGVLGAHPDVVAAAVVPVPDPIFQQEVKAVVVMRQRATLAPRDLWRWCEEHLAHYKVPRYIEFRDSLPLSGSGRVQKEILRSEGIAGRPNLHDRRAEPVAP